MQKELVTHFTYNTIESQAVGGTVAVFDLSKGPNKKLYLFVEIESSDKDNEPIITALSSQLQHHFYSAPTETIEYAFENALAKANAAIKDNLLTKPKNWLTKIHIAAVASKDDEVHISTVGNVRAYLIHQDRIIDILGNGTSNTKAQAGHSPNPIKLFSNIVSGSLYQDTAIAVLNDTILDYLSEERIRKCIKEHTAQGAVLKIEELLAKAPPTKQFGIALLKRTIGTEPVTEAVPETGTPKTKKKVAFEERTEEQDQYQYTTQEEDDENNDTLSYLKPTEGYEMDTKGFNAQSVLVHVQYYATTGGQKALTYTLAGISWALSKIQKGIKHAGPFLSKLPALVLNIWKNRNARAYHFSKLKKSFKETTHSTTEKVAKASPTQKYVLLTVGVLILLFVGSIVFRARENTIVAINEGFADQKTLIEQQLNEAEAALIYNNESRARQVLKEVSTLLDAIVLEYPKRIDELDAVREKMTTMQNRSDKKQVLAELKPFVSIIPAPLSPAETGLVSLENGIFFYDGVQERIAQLDTTNALLLSLPLDTQGIESFSTATLLDETTIAAISSNTVLFIDTEDETLAKQSFVYTPQTALPFTSYARNLYTLDPETKTIIRYRRAGNGFTAAQEWMQETYDFTGMTDVAVDGFIYTLHESGDIHVFLRGAFNKKIDFPIAQRPTGTPRFYTTEDMDTFYILDSENERIVHMTKNGELVVQYVSPLIKQATGFVVDAEETFIYVLANDNIYQIEVQK